MIFWLIACALAVLVTLVFVLALRKGQAIAEDNAQYDIRVYKDQLSEVEKDLARGILSEEDAERTRLEISRRILEADRAASERVSAGRGSRTGTIVGVVICAAIVVGGSVAIYARYGAPGYPDMPLSARIAAADEVRATRPTQAEAEEQLPVGAPAPEASEEFLTLLEQLRRVVDERPNDPQGLALLARNEAAMGNFKDAYAAQSRLIALKGDEATPSDFADLADMMILAAGGYISPEAEAALNAALERQPRNGVARYYMGLLQAQVGRFDLAFQTWRGLLEESTPNAPWIPAIRQGLPELAFRAGVNYELPALVAQTPALRGPDAAAIEAAGDMSAEDRQAFIRNMVEQLNDRLASEGGNAQEWAQLIGALSTLGESERAQAIYAEALNVFAEDAASLSLIRSAGASAGLSE